MSTGVVFDIKEFAVFDGPGIRTTVFMKGCPLRCQWCHNPEGLSPRPQLMVSTAACVHCGACERVCRHPGNCVACGDCIPVCHLGLRKIAGVEWTAEALAARLNKDACHLMQKYRVHSCTDVTGFGLLGHGLEMAQGSGCTLHLSVTKIPYHKEAEEFAGMGFVPAGAYRNRNFAESSVLVRGKVSRAMQDILYDPQTSGGLLIAVDEKDSEALLRELEEMVPGAQKIGYVTEPEEKPLILENGSEAAFS